ncbi:XRE family transcriptional regulator [Streptomyces sp. NBC_01808]|uniref:XRE family transcriptional regulator n=1 Tax=Streptomyces sp. NBC_01808 TaxID=2975947 RepID=UPI002DDA31CC|nr:XRE family transcriptional regulator [Streptomyces sp. NBC_01808]WSA39507.1 XRE family transcriptional regulator [Streptomyces sp. NBC_01808]
MYDRTLFRAVAQDKGDAHYLDTAARLKVAPTTAWRLWTGKTAPSLRLAAAVEAAYGVPAARLLKPAEAANGAAT